MYDIAWRCFVGQREESNYGKIQIDWLNKNRK